MINPYEVTNYQRSKYELEEFLLFCIVVAGKTAYIQAQKLDNFLNTQNSNLSPFQYIKYLYESKTLLYQLVLNKIGQYNKIYNAFSYISESNLDLSNCTVDELEKIPGVGPKTSRFFLVHSRNCQHAILDTHVLKWLKSIGYNDVPKSSPTNKNVYKKWENIFLSYCRENHKDIAQFDLEIWNKYSKKKKDTDEN